MKGFGLDGKLFRGLSKAGDFLILALITVICCIPVITIGASLTAAFYSGMRLVKDEENYVYKDFFKSFKTNFVQGFIMEVVLAVIGVVLFIDLRACAYWAFSGSGSMIGNIFMYAIVGCFVVWGGVVLYSFAVLARYDDKAFTVLKNSLILCTHHLPQTIIMMVATYGLMFFSFKYFTAYIVTIPLFIYIDSYIFTRIFKSLENTNEQRAREEQEAAARILLLQRLYVRSLYLHKEQGRLQERQETLQEERQHLRVLLFRESLQTAQTKILKTAKYTSLREIQPVVQLRLQEAVQHRRYFHFVVRFLM